MIKNSIAIIAAVTENRVIGKIMICLGNMVH